MRFEVTEEGLVPIKRDPFNFSSGEKAEMEESFKKVWVDFMVDVLAPRCRFHEGAD